MMVSESSQAHKSTHYDPIFIRSGKTALRAGGSDPERAQGALLFIYHFSVKKQRGHTFEDLELCKDGKIS